MEKPFTVYKFKIYKNNVEFKCFEKRYSEFQELHQAIEIHLKNFNMAMKLPEMPPKFSASGKKTFIQ